MDKGNAPYFEYVMTKDMAKDLLDRRRGDELKKRPQDYLKEYVNSECGIMGTCVKVILE